MLGSAIVRQKNYLEMTIELSEPAELHDLVIAMNAFGRQFNQFIKDEYPEYAGDTKIYVKQIRAGSIIADLFPFIQPLVQNIELAILIDNFIRQYKKIFTTYLNGERKKDASRNDLRDILDQIGVIAKDSDGKIKMVSLEQDEDGNKTNTRVNMEFDTEQSEKIEENVQEHKKEVEAKEYGILKNVLMVFWQSNVKDIDVGKRTGEKVIIEEVSKKPLAVVYDSDLAEEKIKYETKDGDRNLYKLGFYVDCNVEYLNQKPVAIRISEVIKIIELPDD